MKNYNRENIFWNLFAGRYDRFISKNVNNTYNKIKEFLSNEISMENNVLEVGTGTGIFSLTIAECVESIVAITKKLNTIPFKSGLIKLEGVSLKNNLAHTYRITFFGNTVELPDIIGDDKLGSLPFSEAKYNLTYDSDTIKTKLEIASGGGAHIITPLITHTQALFYNSTASTHNDAGNLYWHNASGTNGVVWNELKYALRLYEIIEQIEDFDIEDGTILYTGTTWGPFMWYY